MAHFAKLGKKNIVEQVIVIHNNELLDELGNESEQKGIDFCLAHYGGTWVQTSYNAATNGFRKNYAGIGYSYDSTRNAFIAPKPDSPCLFNEETCQWEVPLDER